MVGGNFGSFPVTYFLDLLLLFVHVRYFMYIGIFTSKGGNGAERATRGAMLRQCCGVQFENESCHHFVKKKPSLQLKCRSVTGFSLGNVQRVLGGHTTTGSIGFGEHKEGEEDLEEMKKNMWFFKSKKSPLKNYNCIKI